MRQTSKTGNRLISLLVLLSIFSFAFGNARPTTVQASEPKQAAATTDIITLKVVSARAEPKAFDGAGVLKGAEVPEYQFMISVDNTGNPAQPATPDCFPYLDSPANTQPNPNYPDGCDWPGVRTVPGWAPVYTKGNQNDLNDTQSIQLPPGKYLISVTANGYKIDGQHFTIPMEVTSAGTAGVVEVGLHPLPLPPAEMTILVFNDQSMTNGQYDAPVEQGLEGFRASINDIAGEVTVDLFGNPLCTEYEKDANGETVLDADGAPVVASLGNGCVSDANGYIRIPNIGPLRYDVLVIPPDGQRWIQTTTLEGSQGWDTWLQEGGTGMDNEFIVAGEPFPWTIFGFVHPSDSSLPPTQNAGSIKGVIMAAQVYSPFEGGLPYQGQLWNGMSGAKIDRPIPYPWLSLNDLTQGDTAIWVGQGKADGSFEIPNVPPGNYTLTYWDEKQHYILDFVQVVVAPNEVTDLDVQFLTGWFTEFYGTVFYDNNENGKRDPGEDGVPDYLVVLKDRDNTEIDRMSINATTDASGFYEFPKAYPMGSWMVLEAYSDRYRTTGITFQASNQPEETTILGNGVDVGVLPILGQRGRLDWGVKFYEPGENGGIVGTVFYDTVRSEDDAQYAGAEPWQPGIPGLTMKLYATVKDPNGDLVKNLDGSYQKGALLATAETETYTRAKNCQARDVDGRPLEYPSGLASPTGDKDCLEGPMMGVQFDTNFATLDGNYGFTEIMTDTNGQPLATPAPLPLGEYLVEVEIPRDPLFNRPVFQVTREEDLNVFGGDTYVPAVPPPACAGPQHIVDVAGVGTDGPDAVVNPAFAEAGGSRFEGEPKALCNVKLVSVTGGRSIAPIFTLFTEVPIPGRWKGYIIDDINLSTNPFELFFGEKRGLPSIPIGIYDYTGHLVEMIQSDPQGVYEVLLPSTDTYNAPTPSGMLANVYYIYGNDPGSADKPNPLYNPQYRSIGTSFEIYPGVIVPSDLAPVQNGINFKAPTSQFDQMARCSLDDTTPQIYTVSQPYLRAAGNLTLIGAGFGATAGIVSLGNTRVPVVSWSERQIVVSVPATLPVGPYQIVVTGANGKSSVNGLTFHRLGNGYNPRLFEVGPGRPYATIQSAVDAAARAGNSLVVVYPNTPVPYTNPMGAYFENVVLYSPVKLQGVGPGGIYTDTTSVAGSIIDGRGIGGDTPYTDFWRSLVSDIWLNRGGWDGSLVDNDGNPRVYEGPVVTVLAKNNEFRSNFAPSIDGFTLTGGDQQGFPNNLNQVGGGRIPGVQPQVVVQGGGVFVNAYARYLKITNNIIQSNGGAYAGGIRVGTPDIPQPLTDHQNDFVTISHNRILANGGTNLAGAVGLFAGAEGYDVSYNDLCGNFSGEYGGGISHYGYSPNGKIHHNRIYFNQSYDEGGGIMIAGQLPADFRQLSPGSGPVDIYANQIQTNLSNDDGGGIRFLMAGNFIFNVYNNIIANNISTHEGGGISLNDAPRVRIYNNTIMKNITTATAMTSDGLPAPAGVSTVRHSVMLQNSLPNTAQVFSNPLLFNNLFWDNRAGTWNGDGVSGIGLNNDPNPIFHWDLGVADNSGVLSPTYSLMQEPYLVEDPSNLLGLDPLVLSEYDTQVKVQPWRGNPNFVGANIVAIEMPPNLMGDYHLQEASPAVNKGINAKAGLLAPNQDVDQAPRPSQGGYEIGADEINVTFPATPVLAAAQNLSGQQLQAAVPPQWAEAAFRLFLPFMMNRAQSPLEWLGQTVGFQFLPQAVQVVQGGAMVWKAPSTSADQEVYFTFDKVSPQAAHQDLLLKVSGMESGGINDHTRLVDIEYDAAQSRLTVKTLSEGGVWIEHGSLGGFQFKAGDLFGVRSAARGILEVYQNGERILVTDLGDAWAYTGQGGQIGVWFAGQDFSGANGASFNRFGGGTMP